MTRKRINFVAQQGLVTLLFTAIAFAAALALRPTPVSGAAGFLDWIVGGAAGVFTRAGGTLRQICYGFAIGAGLLLVARVSRVFERPIQDKPWTWSQVARELTIAAMWLWCASLLGLLTGLQVASGHTRLYFDARQYGLAYTVLSVPLLMVLFDAWYFFFHRAMHTYPRFYIRVHAVHHATTRPVFITGLQTSPFEQMGIWAFVTVVLATLPLHPQAILCFAVIGNVKSFLGHCGYEAYPRIFMTKWLSWISVSTHHDLHHTAYRCNYSYFFTWWDRAFGTLHSEYAERCEAARVRRPAAGSGALAHQPVSSL